MYILYLFWILAYLGNTSKWWKKSQNLHSIEKEESIWCQDNWFLSRVLYTLLLLLNYMIQYWKTMLHILHHHFSCPPCKYVLVWVLSMYHLNTSWWFNFCKYFSWMLCFITEQQQKLTLILGGPAVQWASHLLSLSLHIILSYNQNIGWVFPMIFYGIVVLNVVFVQEVL